MQWEQLPVKLGKLAGASNQSYQIRHVLFSVYNVGYRGSPTHAKITNATSAVLPYVRARGGFFPKVPLTRISFF